MRFRYVLAYTASLMFLLVFVTCSQAIQPPGETGSPKPERFIRSTSTQPVSPSLRPSLLTATATSSIRPLLAATAPSATIEGPETAKLGELVILDAKGSQAETITWLPISPDTPFLTDDKRIAFAGQPGIYRIVLICSSTGDDGKPVVATAVHVVVIENATPPHPPAPPPRPIPPGPVPTPTPGPSPAPDLPSGKYGLAKMAHSWVSKVPQASRRHAPALGASFSAIASQIAAGALVGKENISKATLEKNREAIGNDRQDWIGFFVPLQTALQAFERDGSLVSDADHAIAWSEIATGLKARK